MTFFRLFYLFLLLSVLSSCHTHVNIRKNTTRDNELYVAVMENRYNDVVLAHKNGACLDATNNLGDSLLLEAGIVALSSGDFQVFEYFVNNGADIDCCSTIGDTPLMYAAASGKLRIIKKIYTLHPGQISLVNHSGEDALCFAVRHPNVVKWIAIKMGKEKVHFSKALKYAIERNQYTSAETLLIYKGFVTADEIKSLARANIQFFRLLEPYIDTTEKKIEFIKSALLTGNTYIIEFALLNCPEVNIGNLIEYAVRGGNLAAVRSSLQKGGNLYFSNERGETLLHLAVRNKLKAQEVSNAKSVISYLIENGLDVNRKDNYGYTPLMEAACSSHPHIIRTLIEFGANPNLGQSLWESLLYNFWTSRANVENCTYRNVKHGTEIRQILRTISLSN